MLATGGVAFSGPLLLGLRAGRRGTRRDGNDYSGGNGENIMSLTAVWRNIAFLATGLAAVVVGPIGADNKPAAKAPAEIDRMIMAEVKDRARVQPNLTHLCDVIGARMTGSANLKKANDWTAEQLKSYGLENVRLEPWEIPAAWERGVCRMRLLEPANGREIHAAARAWTPGTKGKVSGPVVVVQAAKAEDLKAYEGKLKNAILMLSPPSEIIPVSEVGKPRDKKSAAGSARPRPGIQTGFALRNQIVEMAQKEGAACLLTDSAKPHGLLNMTGSWKGPDRATASDPLPAAFVTHDHYAMLHRLATRKDAPPVRLEVEIENKTIPGPVTVFNTVGEIRGATKPDEFVVVGAHLDSWDLGQGATDNGTGTTVVLETARVLGALAKQGIRPARTIRFVLFTGEEQGLFGSKEYVKRHKAEMAKTSMALVYDTGTGRVTEIPLQGFDDAKPVLEKELEILKELDVKVVAGTQGGTDHLSFAAEGVPGFAFHQDPAEYYLTHHTQSDTLDKARWPDLVQGAQVMSLTAMRVANLPDLLPRKQAKPAAPAPSPMPPAEAKPSVPSPSTTAPATGTGRKRKK